jgi:hypothetical protein
MTGPIKKQEGAVAPALAMAGKFGRYKPEEERAVRRVEVRLNPALQKIIKVWELPTYIGIPDLYYNGMLDLLKTKKAAYTAKDVEAFSIALAKFQDERRFSYKAGLFLSALADHCREDAFVIHTTHLTRPVHEICYMNRKNIIVDGNVGMECGRQMMGGSITVNGDAGNYVGEDMADGLIIVNGDAGNYVGARMERSIINVEGKAGGAVGLEMRSGAIFLEGGFESIGESIRHGKIFNKGKLIVDK